MLSESGLWIFDTLREQWYLVNLSEPIFRPFSSATTIVNKGAILFLGSNSTGMLNIERVIRRIEQTTQKDKRARLINLNSKEVWNPVQFSGHSLSLMHHQALLLPDFESVFVFGGVLSQSGELNTKILAINTTDNTVKSLETTQSLKDIEGLFRVDPAISIWQSSPTSTSILVQLGHNKKDTWVIDLNLTAFDFKASAIMNNSDLSLDVVF
jgi:hypothetical protein